MRPPGAEPRGSGSPAGAGERREAGDGGALGLLVVVVEQERAETLPRRTDDGLLRPNAGQPAAGLTVGEQDGAVADGESRPTA
jgi:hypothetical protein